MRGAEQASLFRSCKLYTLRCCAINGRFWHGHKPEAEIMSNNRSARRAWAAAIKRHVKRGSVFHVEIQHDGICGIYAGHSCNCDPDHVLKDDKGRVLAAITGVGCYNSLEFAEAIQ